MGPVGVSTGGATAPGSTTAEASGAAPSPLPPDYKATLTKVDSHRFVPQGHAGGRFEADVYVTPAAKDAAFGLLGKIEPGTILVMDQTSHGKSEGGPTLMMEKRPPGFDPGHGDWRYVVVEGQIVQDGPLALCVRCHDEAPHDHVFSTPD